MILEKMLMAATSEVGYQPNAVKFDGANDYLTRGADLTSAADSKSGIFSAWIRLDGGDATLQTVLANLLSSARFSVTRTAANKFRFLGKNSAGTNILDQATTAIYLASAKWVHVLAAWDLAATTAYIYINDTADVTSTTKTNDTIDYVTATPNWSIGSETDGTNKSYAGIAELYFAPGQYLDFSTESNRRKFIDASGLPVSLGSDGSVPTGSQPAIYLKGDSAAFGTNSGSGGNFTVNGTLEKASTTPATLPAYNAVDFDGSADYLTRGADLTGIADSKSGVFSAWLRRDGGDGTLQRIFANLAGTLRFHVTKDASNKYVVTGINSAGSTILTLTSNTAYAASPDWIHLLASWDLAATTGYLYVDSSSDLAAGSTKTNDTIDYVTATPNWSIGADTDGTDKLNGAISELYFAPNQYLDLSVQANREKFILNGAPVSLGSDGSTPTGVAPAIYLPNRAALVGTNAGSGGNFTVNGAPKDANSTPVYYYAEPSTFDGTNDYLTKATALAGAASKQMTFSCWVRIDTAQTGMFLTDTSASIKFQVYMSATGNLQIDGWNSAGTLICSLYKSGLLPSASPVWRHILVSIDLATSVGQIYLDNAAITPSTSSLTNDSIAFNSNTTWAVGADPSGGYRMARTIADLWFNTTYLDISNSANRAKFIDQTTLRPVPLGAKGELPTGSQPLLYLGRDYSNFQTNLGSGGNFTVTGALTRGTTSPSDVEA